MVTININSQSYEVHEEVAAQFSKFISRVKSKDEEISAGLEREEGMTVTIGNLRKQLRYEQK